MSRIVKYGQNRWPIVSTIDINYRSKDKEYPNKLKNVASLNGLVSLSSVQLSSDYFSVFVILKPLEPGKWTGYNYKQPMYQAYLNPQIVDRSLELTSEWEECPSFPNLRLLVRRPAKIKVTYNLESQDTVHKSLEGFQARVFQHELAHLKDTDLLKSCEDIQIIDAHLKEEKEEELRQMLREYRTEKKEEEEYSEKKGPDTQDTMAFKVLRREIVYNVISRR